MGISNHSELKTTINNYLKRSDLADKVDDWIILLESKLNNNSRFRVADMETLATLTCAANNALVNLPTGFLEAKQFWLESDVRKELQLYNLDLIIKVYPASNVGLPEVYAYDASNNIRLAPTPADTYAINLNYYTKIPNLNSSDTTNWLLTNSPDIYLYGCLFEAYNYVRNTEEMLKFKQLRDDAIESYIDSSKKKRTSGALLKKRSRRCIP